MARIPDETIDEIIAASDIVDCDRRRGEAAACGLGLQGALPVPCGEDAVVQRHALPQHLQMLRLRGGGDGDPLPDGLREPELPGRGGTAGGEGGHPAPGGRVRPAGGGALPPPQDPGPRPQGGGRILPPPPHEAPLWGGGTRLPQRARDRGRDRTRVAPRLRPQLRAAAHRLVRGQGRAPRRPRRGRDPLPPGQRRVGGRPITPASATA